nr:hypothetical protein [uncultured Blautia sp.]
MEFLNNLQDKIWTSIFSFFYPVTDCTPLIILMVTGLFAVLFFAFRKKLLHKTYTLGLLEFPILLSVHYITEQLPRLHSRIQLALSTTAGIILQSTDYTKEFQAVSNVQSLSNGSISRYLYYLDDTEVFSGVAPEQLYYHLFKTLKKTRGIFGALQVQKTSSILLFIVLLILICLLVCDLQKKKYLHGIFLLLLSTLSFHMENSLLLSVFVFAFLECTLAQIFPADSCADTSS